MKHDKQSIQQLKRRYRKGQWLLILPLICCIGVGFLLAVNMGSGTPGLDTATWPLMQLRSHQVIDESGRSIEQSHEMTVAPETSADTQNLGVSGDDRNQALYKPETVASIILAATWALLFVNTCLFANEIFSFASENHDGDTAAAKGARYSAVLRKLAMVLSFALALAMVGWAVVLVLVTTNLTTHKYIGLGFFSVFFVLDLVLASSFKSNYEAKRGNGSLEQSDREVLSAEIKRLQQYYSNQAWIVDLPIIIASLLSLFLSGWVKHSTEDISFVKGLYFGGWVVHLAMSQIVFIIVSFRIGYSRQQDLKKATELYDKAHPNELITS